MRYIKIILISSLLTLLPVRVWACDSYDDCMKSIEQKCDELNETETGKNGCIENSRNNMSESYLKAIAYKLADIEKKLDLEAEDRKQRGLRLVEV